MSNHLHDHSAATCLTDPAPAEVHERASATSATARTSLHQRLTAACLADFDQNGPVVLISAQAGTGKSSLVEEWIAAQRSAVGTWLTIDERDNDASTLCFSLAEALSREHPFVGAETVPQSREDADRYVRFLMESVAGVDVSTILVLDDAHKIYSPLALSVLDSVFADAPANLSVVVIARFAPPLAWHHLALSQRLTRIGSADLALTVDEMQHVMAEYGLALDVDRFRIVAQMTQGWPALVRLAGIYLAGRPDATAAIEELRGTPRPISDYLIGEILSDLDAETTGVLTSTSVVEFFNVELAEALLYDQSGVATVLDSLIRTNIITHRLDPQSGLTWMCYHPLLREHLRAEFRRTRHEDLPAIHQRAAHWFESQHRDLDALRHTLLSADSENVLQFLDRRGLGIILDSKGAELISTLMLQAPAIAESPIT